RKKASLFGSPLSALFSVSLLSLYWSVSTNAVGGPPPPALSATTNVRPVPAASNGDDGVMLTRTLAPRLAGAVPAGTARNWYVLSAPMLTYADAPCVARPLATGVAVERSALGAVTKASIAPAAGLMFTTRIRT